MIGLNSWNPSRWNCLRTLRAKLSPSKNVAIESMGIHKPRLSPAPVCNLKITERLFRIFHRQMLRFTMPFPAWAQHQRLSLTSSTGGSPSVYCMAYAGRQSPKQSLGAIVYDWCLNQSLMQIFCSKNINLSIHQVFDLMSKPLMTLRR
jgi:hypothetical protein